MKKLFLGLSLLLTSQVFASNCFNEVNSAFAQAHPKFNIISIKADGILAPNEDRPYKMNEVWNSANHPVEIYYVESAFMARFGHAVLVEPKTCRVERIIEVYFK